MTTEADLYRNHYECKECGADWCDIWSCTCDDRCPKCNTSTSPYKSDDLTFHQAQGEGLGVWMDSEVHPAPPTPGLYWVVIDGESESCEGHKLYEYDAYIALFTVEGLDKRDDGDMVPWGSGEHDEEWSQVLYWWDAPVFRPGLPMAAEK